MADLLHTKRPEGDAPGLVSALPRPADPSAQPLQRVQQMQHDAVVDRQRIGGGVAPARARVATFEEGVAVGIEQGPAVGRHQQILVLETAMHGAEGGQQPRPGIGATFQHLLPGTVRNLLQLFLQGGDGVVVVVQRLAEMEQAALFGGEEENQPHHDGQGGVVLVGGVDAFEQGPAAVLVQGIEGLHQHLDGLADLVAELIGDLLLILGAGLEQGREGAVRGHPEQAAYAEQGMEGAQRQGLVQPEGGVPGGVAAGLAARGIYQHPVLAVGDQAQGYVGPMEQFHHAGSGGGLPVPAGDGPVQGLFGGIAGDEELRLAGHVVPRRAGRIAHREAGEGKVRAQGLAQLGQADLQARGQGLALRELASGIVE